MRSLAILLVSLLLLATARAAVFDLVPTDGTRDGCRCAGRVCVRDSRGVCRTVVAVLAGRPGPPRPGHAAHAARHRNKRRLAGWMALRRTMRKLPVDQVR